MAFFTPSQSPAVVTREIDLTGIVPNVGTSTGVFVGNFRWGPVDKPTAVDNEARIVSLFGTPDTNNSVDFHTAAYFSKYSSELFLIRTVDSTAGNSYDSNGTRSSLIGSNIVKNRENFEDQITSLNVGTDSAHSFIGKYPGDLGNGLSVELCPFDLGDSSFDNWAHKLKFDAAPGTSAYASGKNASNDEVHVAIIDKDGKFSGTKGEGHLYIWNRGRN